MPKIAAEDVFAKLRAGSTQRRVFGLLKDQEWHCRDCEGKPLASGQYAGGGGIQGLERGTGSRPGLRIESEGRYCATCGRRTRHDRWTGETQESNAAANIPPQLALRILTEYKLTDVIEQRQRPPHELVIDHRFPMQRWGASEPPHDALMPTDEIRRKFQLLKKDAAGNHNLLKSRACETCLKTGHRGTPFGVRYWYEGGPNWPPEVPPIGADAEKGCHGCGWYDFEKWRAGLNDALGS